MALANRLSVRHKSGAALQQLAHSIDLFEEVNKPYVTDGVHPCLKGKRMPGVTSIRNVAPATMPVPDQSPEKK